MASCLRFDDVDRRGAVCGQSARAAFSERVACAPVEDDEVEGEQGDVGEWGVARGGGGHGAGFQGLWTGCEREGAAKEKPRAMAGLFGTVSGSVVS